jgi:UDP-N-acetylmuramoylalanine--D-glutamate ligase
VLGLGKSGISSARLLQQKGYQVQVFDQKSSADLLSKQAVLEKENIQVYLGSFPDFAHASLPELLIVSPGISWTHPTLEMARNLGIKVMGEVELAWQYLNHLPWVGITGTNGKTTTTALVAHLWQGAGYRAVACGNIGVPISEIALNPDGVDWIIAELSSYQIEASPSVSPQIGIWTTFTPDHLDRHGTIEAYSNIKHSLLKRSQWAIFNGDDPYLASLGLTGDRIIYTRVREQIRDNAIYFQQKQLCSIGGWQLLGEHNLQNLLMAVMAHHLAGIPTENLTQSIATFKGISHRLEVVGKIGNLTIINDSKATNYDASIVALRSIEQPVLLIAGGQAKAGDPSQWLDMIQAKVKRVFLIGSAVELFQKFLMDRGYVEIEISHTLEQAIASAIQFSQTLAEPVTLLFSPACASLDQFHNFEQRGDRFREICQQYRL